jgi:hypothetical protein
MVRLNLHLDVFDDRVAAVGVGTVFFDKSCGVGATELRILGVGLEAPEMTKPACSADDALSDIRCGPVIFLIRQASRKVFGDRLVA